jgi:hypothetical protein
MSALWKFFYGFADVEVTLAETMSAATTLPHLKMFTLL